jgi:hypothetical protein
VLRGVFIDDEVEHRAGAFLHYAAGTSHSPRAGAEGASILVMYPDG